MLWLQQPVTATHSSKVILFVSSPQWLQKISGKQRSWLTNQDAQMSFFLFPEALCSMWHSECAGLDAPGRFSWCPSTSPSAGEHEPAWAALSALKPAAFRAKLSQDTARYSVRRAQSLKLWKGAPGRKGSSSLTALLNWWIKGCCLHLLSSPYFLALGFTKSAHRLRNLLCLALFIINSIIFAEAVLPRD